MKKHFVAALAALVVLTPQLSSKALAVPGEQAAEHPRLSPEDRAAMLDARLAALKTGLKLTAAQEKNWSSLESALRDVAKARAARIEEWREKMKHDEEQRDSLESLRERAGRLSARAEEMNKIEDAAKPLFETLDDAQKRRFGVLLRMAVLSHFGRLRHWGER